MFVILLEAVVCILLSLYERWSRVRRYWADRSVYHLPPHPFLGSLSFILRINPAEWLRKLYEENKKAPYVGMWLFWQPALILNSYEIAQRVLITDADVFRNRSISTAKKDPLGQNMFMAKDPLWSSIRKRLTTAFTPAKIRAIQELGKTKAKELIQRIKNDLIQKKDINLQSLFADFTNDVISIAAFGVDGNATLTGHSLMREVTKELMFFGPLRSLELGTIFFFPDLADLFGFTFLPKSATDHFRKIFNSAVKLRGGYDKKNQQIRDLLDALLKMKKESAHKGEEMSSDILLAQATVFLLGGYNTAALALSYATYELAFSPQVQDKIYKELVHAKEKNGCVELDGNTLSELTYLNCAIKETLRKYPPMAWLDRVADKDYRIDDKLTITAGTPVFINAIGLHYDPQYYPDPERYNPDRFLLENRTKGIPMPFLAFGDGPRQCLGIRLGYQTVRYALAALILNFKIEPLPNSLRPSQCKKEEKSVFVIPKNILSVQFMLRKLS